MKKIILFSVITVLLGGCATNRALKQEVYAKLYEEKPISILPLPPINRATKVEAKELFFSSLTVPLTQKGYYVMPPLLSMEILKEESAYDAELFINNSMKQVGNAFGVDAVLFTIIHDWRKTTIASQISVKVEYILKSTKTDEVLFHRIGDITMSTSSGGGSLLGLAINMAATALTNEIVVGRQCNLYTLDDLPVGKYDPKYGTDGEEPAGAEEFKVYLRQ